MSREIVVLKFGGSIVNSVSDLVSVRDEIEKYTREGVRVVAVVSALHGVTDRLVEWASDFPLSHDTPAYATLLATGEMDSAARLALIAQSAGIVTKLLSFYQLQIKTTGARHDAEPVSVGYDEWNTVFKDHQLIVVPGFIGVNDENEPTLLGRGGSDLTAVFLSQHLKAKSCLLYKDVGAWFESDPQESPSARRYVDLSWTDAVGNPSPIVQSKTVVFARAVGQPFSLAGIGVRFKTRVGSDSTVLEDDSSRGGIAELDSGEDSTSLSSESREAA